MIDESPVGASPVSQSLYYTDALALAYMQRHFGMRFQDRHGREVFPYYDKAMLRLVTEHGDILRTPTAFVHPASLHLLEPRAGDMVKAHPSPYLSFLWSSSCTTWPYKSVTIIQRGGKPFFSPELSPSVIPIEREEWRSIEGFEGLYEVSSLGQVRRIAEGNRTYAGRILKLTLNKPRGYLVVRLVKFPAKACTVQIVHNLVSRAFLGPKLPGMHVNHIDGVKTNNAASNLEYVTPLANTRHAIETGLLVRDLSPEVVRAIRAMRGQGSRRVGSLLGVCKTTVGDIWSGKSYADVE